MPHILKNKTLEIHIDLPSEGYKHSRFDWTGKIIEVKYKGYSFSGNEIANQKEDPFCGRGFCNEFGINSPLGYDEVEIGEWFHKIGVGLLKKEEPKYQFHKLYKIQPADFNVKIESHKIRIKCQSKFLNGYSYLLEKEIEILDNGFEIRNYLENTGNKTIVTNEYNHNFILLDSEFAGNNYVLKFPFQIKPALFGETVNPEGIVKIGSRDIKLTAPPKKQFFFSNLSGGQMVNAQWELEHIKHKVRISEQGDFQTNSINLWGWENVISPEMYIDINIQAGQSRKWSRIYNIYDVS
jgi:hypothetical protein